MREEWEQRVVGLEAAVAGKEGLDQGRGARGEIMGAGMPSRRCERHSSGKNGYEGREGESKKKRHALGQRERDQRRVTNPQRASDEREQR